MNTKHIASLVSEAIELDQQIAALKERQAVKKGALIKLAKKFLLEEADLKDPINSGASYNFKDDAGNTARVTFPRQALLRAFWVHNGKAFKKQGEETICLGKLDEIKTICEGEFSSLFQTRYVCAKSFRDLAKMAIKNETRREKLLALCSEDSSPRVGFEVKAAAPLEPLGSPDSVRMTESRRATKVMAE